MVAERGAFGGLLVSSRDYAEAFGRKRSRRLAVGTIGTVLVIVLILALPWGAPTGGEGPALAALTVVIFTMLAFVLYDWRCPACGEFLGLYGNPRHCRSCGVTLQ